MGQIYSLVNVTQKQEILLTENTIIFMVNALSANYAGKATHLVGEYCQREIGWGGWGNWLSLLALGSLKLGCWRESDAVLHCLGSRMPPDG